MIRISKYSLDSVVSVAGRLGTAVLTVMMLPLYLPLLGEEAFGLLGIFVSLELFFLILEGGVGNVLVRDIAGCRARKQEPFTLIRSFEVAYLVFGLVQTIVCLALITSGAFEFLNANTLSPETVTICLQVIAFRLLVGLPTVVHDAVLTARGQLVLQNFFRILHSLLASVGAYFVLVATSGDPVAFFVWMLVTSLVILVAKMWACWRGTSSLFFTTKASFRILSSYKNAQVSLIFLSFVTFCHSQQIIWLTGSLLPLATLGLLTVALRFTSAIASSLAAVSRPMLALYAAKEESREGGASVLDSMMVIVSTLGVVGAVFFGFYHSQIFNLWLGDGLENRTVSIVAACLLVEAVVRLCYFSHEQALVADRKVSELCRNRLLSSAVKAGILFWSITSFGFIGVGYGVLGAAVIEFFWVGPRILRSSGSERSWNQWFSRIFLTSLGVALLFAAGSLTIPSFGGVLSEVLLGGAAFLAALMTCVAIGKRWKFHPVPKGSSA